jgi:hypothetical protein
MSEHFEIRYGDVRKSGWDEWIPVALVSRARQELVHVEFLLDRADPGNSEIIKEVVSELNFYLLEKAEPDPWNYLRYHCGTGANIYSSVHWSYQP